MNFDAFLPLVQDKLPKNDTIAIMTLREKFEKLDESKKQEVVNQLPLLNLKSPALVFWVGNILFGNFGVARFMIGDTGLGVVRIILTIITGGIVSSIWTFVDLFIVGKKLRNQNFQKIMQILN